MSTGLLKAELETYALKKNELLAKHENDFVLIHDSEVLGFFKTGHDALKSGYQSVGNRPFLVKRIERFDHKPSLSSSHIGL